MPTEQELTKYIAESIKEVMEYLEIHQTAEEDLLEISGKLYEGHP